MKATINFKGIIVEVICLLYVVLFVYAAVSKFMDFQNFQVQLGQSPLLSAFAGFLAWIIPLVELFISLLICIPKFRKIGLLAGFGLMVMFSIYIWLILNYSSFIPCSCGGILEEMSWKEHLYFNIGFCFIAILALNFIVSNTTYLVKRILTVFTISAVLMVCLYISSEEIVYKRNNFVRRFPPFPAKRIKVESLNANTYYFAGKGNDKIYLGNPTAPSLITELDSTLKLTNTYQFKITDTLFKFLNVKLKVDPPYFFVYDGKVPCVFRGKLDQLEAVLQTRKIPGFTKAVVVDSSTFIIRTLSKSRENLLATLDIKSGQLRPAPALLVKQLDGLFDTDGILQYSSKLEKFVYLYYYRNEYIIADKQLNLIERGNTIDTTSKAAIKIEYVESKKQRKFSAPPLLVNRLSTLQHNLLFVNSSLPGRYDEKKMWKNANVIDVYDILNRTYVLSFYIYKIDGEKIDDISVTDTHLYAIIGSNIVSYKLSGELVKKMNIK